MVVVGGGGGGKPATGLRTRTWALAAADLVLVTGTCLSLISESM